MVVLPPHARISDGQAAYQAKGLPPRTFLSKTTDSYGLDSVAGCRPGPNSWPGCIEDARSLTPDELKERKAYRDEVAKVDLHIEMDWCQRSRQLWLTAGDANTRFFHQVANGRRRVSNMHQLQISDQTYSKQSVISQALSDHFRNFYCCGPPCRWRWRATRAATLPLTQQQHLTVPFSEEEVKVAI